MPDNLKITRPEDAQRINIHEPYEVRNWCKHFNITELELRNAVAKAGTWAKDVKRYLGK